MNETMKLEELTISECPSTPNPSRMSPPEVGAHNCSLSEATCVQEVVVDESLSPKTTLVIPEDVDYDKNWDVPISGSDSDTQDDDSFPFPPVLYREKNSKNFSLTLPKKTKIKDADYDSDETCDDYVECGEKGLCKCRRMRGRQYYEYYAQLMNEEDCYKFYRQGRCVLPRGTILHFTGAPDNMKREDVIVALVALGAKVEFIDYQSGNKEGWARLSFPYEARIIIKKMVDKKLNVVGADLSFKVLSGKDEKRYHKKAIEGIFQLQEKAKGLNRKLKKAGYKYVPK